MEYIFALLFLISLGTLIFSLVKLRKIPKDDTKSRSPFKILCGVSIFILVLYVLIFFLAIILAAAIMHGM